ncbi:hypothetical protein C8F01DRAFT_1084600 [Mycena amicta]|nr:hypothetical protein C8F01DRAFT_1084600 [Mycena amicta]
MSRETVEARVELRQMLAVRYGVVLEHGMPTREEAEARMRELIFNWNTVVPMARFIYRLTLVLTVYVLVRGYSLPLARVFTGAKKIKPFELLEEQEGRGGSHSKSTCSEVNLNCSRQRATWDSEERPTGSEICTSEAQVVSEYPAGEQVACRRARDLKVHSAARTNKQQREAL